MTSSRPPISRLRVEAFRGFRDVREFDLSAAAVVITGPNGTGKTSFFDALQWGLLGRLERLESLRARRNVEHVVNQYRLGRKATVEIDLDLPDRTVTVRRTGDQSGSTLELRSEESSLFGDEAEAALREHLLPHADLTLDSALSTSGLMQQDVMRRVLEAKPADRYRQLTTVLGLGELEDFEDATRAVAKQASEMEKAARGERARLELALEQARERAEASQARLANRPQVAAVREETRNILERTPLGITVDEVATLLDSPDDIRRIAAAFGSAADELESIRAQAQLVSRLREGLSAEPSERELVELTERLATAQEARSAADTAARRAHGELSAARKAAAEVAQLAALAVPMLTDTCPVCNQRIDREHVERELLQRAEATGVILELERAATAASSALSDADAAVVSVTDGLAEAQQNMARWAEARAAEVSAQAAIDALSSAAAVARWDRIRPEAFDAFAGPALEYLRRARRSLLELLETFDRQQEQGAVDRSAAEIRGLESALAAAEGQLNAEAARAARLQALAEQTLESRVEVTESRLRSIQPLVANIFQRLDPHPAFKTVEFELDTYYRRGTTSPMVIDQVENIAADPLLIFSTSQANIVALSYFIAMSVSADDRGLPFLLLDDPVQSMDDVNVLGFADLCRHLRLRRQLIVSTHERRFASLLERKLAPRVEGSTTKMIRFTGWDRSGPTVDESFIDAQLIDDPIRLVHLAG